jgi:aspartyl-tRNA(Asn)/glutamyl-tRNA(Gln) amidotransferase subunit A
MTMHTLSAVELRKKFGDGELSAVEITRAFLTRIETLNPKTNAFLALLDERAHDKAKALDEKRAKGEKLGKLAGVPIAVKDNIHIRGELTTCGSKFLANYRAPFTASVLEYLEAEGAILIGKTNLDEFAMGSSNEHSAFGPVCNPWNLDYVPGGSSGGSAVAVAARMAPLSLGSDTGGSVRQPAALTGCFGFKPTYGRVSRYGLVAFASSLDQIGPFANRAEDIGLIMETMGQHDARDSTSLPNKPDRYTFGGDLKGVRVGVPYSFLEGLSDEVRANLDASLEVLKGLGATLIDVDLDILKYSVAIYYVLATAEASTNLARFDGVRYGVRAPEAKTLAEVYDLSKAAGFGAEVKRRILLGTYVLSAGYQDAYYKQAQRVRTLVIRAFGDVFKQCDVVVTPTSPTPAFKIGAKREALDEYLADVYTIGANLAGLPGLSVPAGFTDSGLPLGLQVLGPQQEDVRVVQVGHTFEKATGYNEKVPDL